MSRQRRTVAVRLVAVLATLVVALVASWAVARADETSGPGVSVSWEPQVQTEAGSREVALSVSLEDGSEAALVDISLSEEQAGMLRWDGNSVEEASLGNAENPTADSGVILIERTDGGATLRFLLKKEDSSSGTLEQSLTFALPEGETETSSEVEVDAGSILVKAVTGDDAQPSLNDSILTSQDDGVSTYDKGLTPFTVYAEVPPEVRVSGPGNPVALDGESADIEFSIDIQKFFSASDEGQTESKTYSAELTLPDGVYLPGDAVMIGDDGLTILCGETEIGTLSSPSPLPAGLEVSVARATRSGLVLSVTVPSEAQALVDPLYYDLSLTLHGRSLVRDATAINGQVGLSVSAEGGEDPLANAGAAITASQASTPQEGWHVESASSTDLPQSIFWVDNNDEDGIRPTKDNEWGWSEGSTLAPRLFFVIDGVYRELNADNMSLVGLEEMPTLELRSDGTLLVKGLPTSIHETDGHGNTQNEKTVSWSIEPPATVPSGYELVNVTAENEGDYPSVSTQGWYYILQDTFSFTLDVRPNEDLNDDQLRGLLGNFQLEWSYGTDGSGAENIGNLSTDGESVTCENGKVTISGLWRYNIDGTPISYAVVEEPDDDGEIDKLIGAQEASNLPANEWYQIHYVNTGVPNYGDDTTAIHSGGTLRLVRQGVTSYTATKVWMDQYVQNPGEGTDRPEPTFTLYRYLKGDSYRTATQVSGVTTSYAWSEEEEKWVISVVGEGEGGSADLPKYDAQDGREYVYVVRETLSGGAAGSYEQVFGTVTIGASGEVTVTEDDLAEMGLPSREDGNTFLYNEDTLTNRRTDTVPVTATKTWQASSEQDSLKNMGVRLKLQYRVKGAGGAWSDYLEDEQPKTVVLDDFYAEKRSDSVTLNMPKYQPSESAEEGKELEYRWVETAILVGEDEYQVTYGDDEGSGENGSLYTTVHDVGGHTYEVTCRTSNTEDADASTIVNRLVDTVDYHVTKTWEDIEPTNGVTLNIYRTVTGTSFDFDADPIAVVQFDENGELVDDESTYSEEPDGNWSAVVKGLPRYDDEGREYEYLLLEDTGSRGAFPTYETSIDQDGNYHTEVINAPGGEAITFLVRKNWLDESDVQHREPVTLELYNKYTETPVLDKDTGQPYTVTLGNTSDGSEPVWYEVVRIPLSAFDQEEVAEEKRVTSADDIYLVETQVGDSPVAYPAGADDEPDKSYGALYEDSENDGQIVSVKTQNHRYQVTYQVDYDTNDVGGIQASFVVQNRRLGNIDITVNKTWVDGSGEASEQDLKQQIAEELKEIYGKSGDVLALAFRLEFANQDAADSEKWDITYSGPWKNNDTVTIVDEEVPIYAGRNEDGSYDSRASSEQLLIGLKPDGESGEGELAAVINDSAHFFGLPKYDVNGNVVSYTVKEVWLKVSDDGTEVLTNDDLKRDYSNLYNLWSTYRQTYAWSYEPNVDEDANTLDKQTLDVENIRTGTKDVSWTKQWKDAFTDGSNPSLRPDLFFDVYRVVHVVDEEASEGGTTVYKRQIERVNAVPTIGMNGDTWTISLDNVAKYDSCGFEIFYYAVERTMMSASDYDYQAARYSLDERDLGTRDEPGGDASVLSANTEGIVGEDEKRDILVLGAASDAEPQDNVDSIEWANPSDQPTDIGPFGSAKSYPKYALVEGGTFTNTLDEEYTVEGVKYWDGLPNGWGNEYSLPSVTFTVYRYVGERPTSWSQENEAATLTISSGQWENLRQTNGGYRYLVQYVGENTLAFDGNGNLVCLGDGEAKRLSRYDDNGALYTYEVEETEIGLADEVEQNQVFESVRGGTGFTFTNTYAPERGSIYFKKFLYLPDKDDDGIPDAFPAVTFRLTQQMKVDDKYVTTSFSVPDVVLSSKRVQELWNKLNESNAYDGYVTADDLEFENLPIYAPDGSEYRYTIGEVTGYLEGYDTYASKGGVSDPSDVTTEADFVGELVPTATEGSTDPQATFKNQQPETPEDLGSELTATKVWEDFGFSFRPTKEDFAKLLVVTRRAPAQGGSEGAGSIDPEILTPTDDDNPGKVTVTINATDEDTWNITITANDGFTFERYAPNGAEWIYELSEPLTTANDVEDGAILGRLKLNADDPGADENKVYTPSEPNGVWPTAIRGSQNDTSFGTLTNSTHANAAYKKVWLETTGTDEDGKPITKPITEDYLGFNLKVTFKLQARTQTGGEFSAWEDARSNEYVKQAMGSDWSDEATLSGPVNADESTWSGTFEGLPGVVKDPTSGAYVFLAYRVIETEVSYGDHTQTIGRGEVDEGLNAEFDYEVENRGLVTSASFERDDNLSVSSNVLDTTSVTVAKTWDDGENQYGTRPGSTGPYTWSAWYVLQRSSDGGESWEVVDLFEMLYGGNSADGTDAPSNEKWSDTISGLPTTDWLTNSFYIYRVRELQYREGGYSLPAKGSEDYTTAVASIEGAIVEDESSYVGSSYTGVAPSYTTTYDDSDNSRSWTVTNALDWGSVTATKRWAHDKHPDGAEVTFQLQYKTEGDLTYQNVPFEHQATQVANDTNGWTVTWTDLPSVIGGKTVVEYRVVELSGDGWVQVKEDSETGSDGALTYTFTNSVTTTYEVEKEWNLGTTGGGTRPAVTLALYRTTDPDAVESTNGEPVPINEMNPDGEKRTVELDGTVDEAETEPWKATFEGLPRYDANGNEYRYYVLELNGSEKQPIAEGGVLSVDDASYVVTYEHAAGKTVVTNTEGKTVSGVKTWLDNNNIEDSRPEELVLDLWRTTGDVQDGNVMWEYVDATPEWVKSDDEWTYTYHDLPAYDENGNPYAYQVVEHVPSGYEQVSQEGYKITNVRVGTMAVTGTKTWVEGNDPKRPESISLLLERSTDGGQTWETVNTNPDWSKGFGNQWSFSFANLPEFNDEGVRYQYRVTEQNVDPGYEAAHNGYDITNYQRGELRVEKVVQGNRGEYDRAFTFTVGLTGASYAGTEASDVSGSFDATLTHADGTSETKTVSFVNGVVEGLELAHGESVTIHGLPAGIGYEVTEAEAGRDGYTTTSVGSTGTVPVGDVATATFTNYRHHTPTTSVTGTKTWVDNGDEAGLRPEGLTVRLYRRVDGGEWQLVHATPTWSKSGDVWTYTFGGLPVVSGAEYRVEEVVPEGYEASYSGLNITNTLKPDEPEEPDEPDEPEEPTEPTEPEEPTEPSEPTEPAEPSVPSQPGEPGTPSVPAEPGRPETPDTGDQTVRAPVAVLLLMGCVLVTAAAVLLRRNR